MTETSSPAQNVQKTRIITQILTTAIKLWLKTQLNQVSQIEVEIGASDRQLLSGRIPSVLIFATHAIYQGLHVTKIKLQAQNIQINIGAVLKGKPLQLLEIVPVSGELTLEEQDLNNSLSSQLLSTALNDVLVKLLPEDCQKCKSINWEKITLDNNRMIMIGTQFSESESAFLEIGLNLELLNGQELQFRDILIQKNQQILLENNSGETFYLGSDVNLEEISIIPGKIVCRGGINVKP